MRLDVENAIKEFDITVFGNKKNIERAEKLLKNGEKVLFAAPTNAIITTVNIKQKEKLPGIFFLTDKRILFSYKIGISEKDLVFSLDEIKSINSTSDGITGSHIEIHTLTQSIDILVSYQKSIMQKIQSVIETAANSFKNQTKDTNQNSAADEILKYKQLYDIGAITEDEYNAKKIKLLNL